MRFISELVAGMVISLVTAGPSSDNQFFLSFRARTTSLRNPADESLNRVLLDKVNGAQVKSSVSRA